MYNNKYKFEKNKNEEIDLHNNSDINKNHNNQRDIKLNNKAVGLNKKVLGDGS